jgi:hypothetical protein
MLRSGKGAFIALQPSEPFISSYGVECVPGQATQTAVLRSEILRLVHMRKHTLALESDDQFIASQSRAYIWSNGPNLSCILGCSTFVQPAIIWDDEK